MDFKVHLDPSTRMWLVALARANNTTPNFILEEAAFCFANSAGRRTGSWEADTGGNMLTACGFQKEIPGAVLDHVRRVDAARNERIMQRIRQQQEATKP